MASQTTNASILAPQTTKTFEKDLFWQNISIIPLSRVIFQLKNKIKSKNKNIQKIQKKSK
jgi:hypothetical protein